MSLHIMDKLRAIAGVMLEIFPVPDGELRETLLDIANPCRQDLKEIVRKSDAEDERAGLRKAFKAFDTQHVPDDKAADLLGRVLDPNDIHTVTASHEQTIGALTSLRDKLANGGTETEENKDKTSSVQKPPDMSDEEVEAVREFLENLRKGNETEPVTTEPDEPSKTEPAKSKTATKATK